MTRDLLSRTLSSATFRVAVCIVVAAIGFGFVWQKLLDLNEEISCSVGPCGKFNPHSSSPKPINLQIGEDRFRSSWSIPSKYVAFAESPRDGARGSIYLRVPMADVPNIGPLISEKCRTVENSETEREKRNSLIENIPIQINPGIPIEKDIMWSTIISERRLEKISSPIPDLDLFFVRENYKSEDSEYYLRPIQKEIFPDTYFHSLREVNDRNIVVESTTLPPNIILQMTYNMCWLENWPSVDENIKRFLQKMIVTN